MTRFVKKLRTYVMGVSGSLLMAQSALASVDSGAGSVKPSSGPTELFGKGSLFQTIADLLIFLVGAVAVIMLIVGGFRYVVSQGNDKEITAAKDTILYSVIGIVVAIAAYAVVHFVSNQLKG